MPRIPDNWKRLAREYWPLAALLLLAALLRLPSPNGLTYYSITETYRDLDILKGLNHGQAVLLGPPSIYKVLRFGPFYYYLYYPFALLFGFRMYSLAMGSLFFSLLTILLAFFTAERWFQDRRIAYLTAFLLSVSALDVQFAKYGSNPNTLPFFGLLFFYQLEKFVRGRQRGADAMVLGAAFAVATQLHSVAFVSLPLALLMALAATKGKGLRPKDAILFAAAALLLYLPYIAAEISNGFADIAGLFTLAGDSSIYGTFANRYVETGYFWLSLLIKFNPVFIDAPVAGMCLLSANVVLVVVAWYLDKRWGAAASAAATPASVKTVLAIWLAAPMAVLLLPIGGIDSLPIYYFTLLVPLGYLLAALGLGRALEKGLRLTACAAIASFLFWQAVQHYIYHAEYPSFLIVWLQQLF